MAAARIPAIPDFRVGARLARRLVATPSSRRKSCPFAATIFINRYRRVRPGQRNVCWSRDDVRGGRRGRSRADPKRPSKAPYQAVGALVDLFQGESRWLRTTRTARQRPTVIKTLTGKSRTPPVAARTKAAPSMKATIVIFMKIKSPALNQRNGIGVAAVRALRAEWTTMFVRTALCCRSTGKVVSFIRKLVGLLIVSMIGLPAITSPLCNIPMTRRISATDWK